MDNGPVSGSLYCNPVSRRHANPLKIQSSPLPPLTYCCLFGIQSLAGLPAAQFAPQKRVGRLGRLSHFMGVIRATFGTYGNLNRGGYEKLELVENKGRKAVLIAEISAIRLDQKSRIPFLVGSGRCLFWEGCWIGLRSFDFGQLACPEFVKVTGSSDQGRVTTPSPANF